MMRKAVEKTNEWLNGLGSVEKPRPIVWIISATVIALAIDYALPPYAKVEAVFLLFFPTVFVAAFVGGFKAGLLATVAALFLGGLGGPEHGFSNPMGMVVFAAIGVGVSAFGDMGLKVRRGRTAAVRLSKEREAHLQSIFDTAPEAVIVINASGIVQSYGIAAERIFQWRAADVIGKNIKMLMPPQFRKEHDGYLERYSKTGEKHIIGIGRMVLGQRKDGSTFPMQLAVGEVKLENTNLFTGFVRDLTEQVESQSRMRELQSEVIHISRSNAMGEMASALAHELNQPLSAITNYLRGAQRLVVNGEPANEKVIEAIRKAGDQALRAGDIIKKLRDFLSKGEGERKIASASKVIHDAGALALVGAKEGAVDVRYHFDARLDRVLVDQVQIQQVMVNLVRNAIEAMENQPVKQLVISTRVRTSYVEVIVSDTGSGIDEAVAAKLFQPFVSSKPSGMGVGLSISRTIIEAHGGRLWVEPNPTGGTIFKFTLNLAAAEESVA